MPEPSPSVERRTLALPLGETMEYSLALPERRPPDRPLPFVLALHHGWSGESPPVGYGAQFLERLVLPGLGSLDAVIVAPDAIAPWITEEGEASLVALVDALFDELVLDPRRTALTGFSLGGMATWFFQARGLGAAGGRFGGFAAGVPIAAVPVLERFVRPETVRGHVASLLEEPDGSWTERLSTAPMYVIHSVDDEVVPYRATESAVAILRSRGAPVELRTLDRKIGHYEVARYTGALRDAAGWVRRVWRRGGRAPGVRRGAPPGFRIS